MAGVRIDKWLWAVRLFKTRPDAVQAIKNNRVMINDAPVKPGREVKVGDQISVRKLPVVYRFRVLDVVANRQPAKLVAQYREDITPPEELQKLEMMAAGAYGMRDRGMGRPTKKERREMDDWLEDFGLEFDEETEEV